MEMVNKGRNMVITMTVIVLLMDIITTVILASLYAVNGMMEEASSTFLQGLFRFILTGLLLFFLYKGHRWAKWLSVILFILAGLIALLSLVFTANIILFVVGAFYAFWGVIMISSGNMNAFFRYQRGISPSNVGESIYHQHNDCD